MSSLNFGTKSHLLTSENIDKYVEKGKIGNYALGHLRDNSFVPKYVGRSDNDLNKRLKDHIPEKYKRFKFMYQTSARNAFLKECENYHDFKEQLDNDNHPQRPKGQSWKCPVKDCEDLD